ncbi:hypothetical protein DWB77_07499 [Streptomyces hundungensis]|uniref:Uncharacterized protein n=1 Tax=Streptomyces hundungensis TaxID=1077946 RepID=A0A387HSR3_9ACTN|nr:hypothetical protein [Streptomyces hundungensis]AYG85282.1 hypothetical protein DWB77_07499 [Streptomyces hundungensis]
MTEEAGKVDDGEQAVLEALGAVLAAVPSAGTGWTDELWDVYGAYEAGRLGQGQPPQLTAEQSARFASQRHRQQLSDQAHGLVRRLRERAEQARLLSPATVAELAVHLVHAQLAAHEAVNLLAALGAPHGERALLALARDTGIPEGDRLWVRERLFVSRRDGYRARGRLAVDGEEPLLPAAVRELPTGIGGTLALPVDPVSARAALDALLPPAPLSLPEPPPEWTAGWDGLDEHDEYRPEWLEVRLLVRELMPTAQKVSRERMAEAERECVLLGLGGGEGEFAPLWTTRIAAWLASEVFDALSRDPHPARLAPWAMDLAGQYVWRGMAVEEARAFLRLALFTFSSSVCR